MHRVIKRVWIMFLFIVILLSGTGFFVGEYFANSENWIIAEGSPHVYTAGNIGCGKMTDRSGTLLLDLTQKRSYSQDAALRMATIHWLGDRQGNISAPAVTHYAAQMSGFDPFNGIYTSEGTGGQAVLTLSAQVQKVALEAMAGRKGTVAVYNYKTGEILCAVSTPNFDPDNVPDIAGDTTGLYNGIYVNRFTQATYIPGSIYKVVTTAAALSSIEDIQNQTFHCTGVYEFGVDKVTCETAHGTNDLRSALARSCNCAYAQIAQQIGAKQMAQYVDRFGITDSVEFDGITTAKGNYDVSSAAPVELAWSCIGQYTDLINPCAYMQFMGAIGGNGSCAAPYLVSSVWSDGGQAYAAKPISTGQIMDEEVALILKEYMRNNVVQTYGAQNFPGLNVCAKSGTSQVGGGQTSNAMFSGFVDDEKYPLAFICVVENGGYGSATCVPVLSRVLAECKAVIDAEN